MTSRLKKFFFAPVRLLNANFRLSAILLLIVIIIGVVPRSPRTRLSPEDPRGSGAAAYRLRQSEQYKNNGVSSILPNNFSDLLTPDYTSSSPIMTLDKNQAGGLDNLPRFQGQIVSATPGGEVSQLKRWNPVFSPLCNNISSIWASSDSDLYVVAGDNDPGGDYNRLYRYDGSAWWHVESDPNLRNKDRWQQVIGQNKDSVLALDEQDQFVYWWHKKPGQSVPDWERISYLNKFDTRSNHKASRYTWASQNYFWLGLAEDKRGVKGILRFSSSTGEFELTPIAFNAEMPEIGGINGISGSGDDQELFAVGQGRKKTLALRGNDLEVWESVILKWDPASGRWVRSFSAFGDPLKGEPNGEIYDVWWTQPGEAWAFAYSNIVTGRNQDISTKLLIYHYQQGQWSPSQEFDVAENPTFDQHNGPGGVWGSDPEDIWYLPFYLSQGREDKFLRYQGSGWKIYDSPINNPLIIDGGRTKNPVSIWGISTGTIWAGFEGGLLLKYGPFEDDFEFFCGSHPNARLVTVGRKANGQADYSAGASGDKPRLTWS
ncbi:MAG: hypothetical protein AAB499_02800, partial [Patescibacteria group bacterium]